ncbi:signal peptidase 22kDa subunit [Pilobolus umbonatus]|nr:signal peptidase 22kDa subunit [Pilobolus umbonatus]
MHNLNQRLSNVFSFAVTVFLWVLGTVSLLSLLTGYGTITEDRIRINPQKIKIVTRRFGTDNVDYRDSKSEFARMTFDIDADFTPLFNWNTKQIFVSAVAEYESDDYNRNSIVVWDKIITSKDKAYLKLKDVGNKYTLIDVTQHWNDDRVNMTLYWDVTPYVGLLQAGHSNSATQFILPSYYNQQK